MLYVNINSKGFLEKSLFIVVLRALRERTCPHSASDTNGRTPVRTRTKPDLHICW